MRTVVFPFARCSKQAAEAIFVALKQAFLPKSVQEKKSVLKKVSVFACLKNYTDERNGTQGKKEA